MAKHSKLQNICRLSLYSIIIFFGCFMILEVAVRFLRLADPLDTQYSQFVSDPFLPYRPKPFSRVTGRSKTNEYDYDYKHNSVGFRDVEHSLAKKKNVFRILGMGDSFTYGAGATFEETYLYRLEKMLNSRPGTHPKIEIIKAGMSRYFTELERLLLQHYGVKYSPDLVVVAFMPNDIIETHLGMEFAFVDDSGYLKTSAALKFGPLGQFLFFHSHVFRILVKKYTFEKILQDHPKNSDDIYIDNGIYEKDWEKVEEEFAKIFKITQSINAKLVILYIPQIGPWDTKHSYPADRLSKWCQKRNIAFIDTLPSIKTASKNKSLYYENDGHCRPEGYKIIADVLFRELTAQKLIP